MGIRIGEATVGAVERVLATLREHLPGKLAALADVGLHLPAPDAHAYYLTGETVRAALQQQPVIVVVEQLRSARYDDEDQLSGDGVNRQIWRVLPLRVRLLFTDGDGYAPLVRAALGDREQLHAEWMLHRARRYGGALAEALLERAQDDHNIERIQLRDDWSGELPPGPDGLARVGGVVQDWDVWQATIAPMAQY